MAIYRSEGIHDISIEATEKTRAQIRRIPDSPQDLSVIEERWRHVVEQQPNLRREIARISLEVAPTDEHLRGRVCSSLIELMLILEDQLPDMNNPATTSRSEEEILQ